MSHLSWDFHVMQKRSQLMRANRHQLGACPGLDLQFRAISMKAFSRLTRPLQERSQRCCFVNGLTGAAAVESHHLLAVILIIYQMHGTLTQSGLCFAGILRAPRSSRLDS